MGWDGMGWDGMGWDGMGFDALLCCSVYVLWCGVVGCVMLTYAVKCSEVHCNVVYI